MHLGVWILYGEHARFLGTARRAVSCRKRDFNISHFHGSRFLIGMSIHSQDVESQKAI